MFIDNFNLNHIRIFESVYRARSMTKAAEELQITQSGVSQHIKHLEEVIGVALFDRVKQRLIPTQQADHFYQSCKDGLATIERAITDLKGVGPEVKGLIQVGATPYASGGNLLTRLAQFGRVHPRVKFKIRQAGPTQLSQWLSEGQVEMVIYEAPLIERQARGQVIAEEELVLIGHRTYLNERPVVSSDKKFFTELDYIDLNEEEGWSKKWYAHHFKGPTPRLKIAAVVFDLEAVADLVNGGLGVAVVPAGLWQKLQATGTDLVQIPVPGQALKVALHLTTLPERTLSPAAQELQSFLRH